MADESGWWSRVARWGRRFRRDVASSLDSNLLGFPRFLGLLYGPVERRVPFGQALKESRRYRLASHVGWGHALGGVTHLLLLVLIATGVLLTFYYRPSAPEAYPSMQYIVSDVSLGWLVRDLHVWSASLLVLVAMAHLAQVFFTAAYKPPRETNWIIGLLLLLVVLAFGATGYLLPWDQSAYWTVTEALRATEALPVFGGFAAAYLRGDVIVSGATLGRFYALHVVVLPWLALGLLVLHFSLIRKHGIAPPIDEPRDPGPGVLFYPTHLLRSLIVVVLTLAVLVSLAVMFPRAFDPPANPYVVPERLHSTWIVVDVSLGLIRFLGVWGFVLFSLLAIALVLLPLFDRSPERHIRRRPFAAVLGFVYFGAFLLAWLVGSQLRSFAPSAKLVPRASQERVLPFGPEFPPEAGDERPEDRVAPAGEEGGASDAEQGSESRR